MGEFDLIDRKRPISDEVVAMPDLEQEGELFVGPAAKKEAQCLGLGLKKISRNSQEKIKIAKQFATRISIDKIIHRQMKTQQENQQKQQMYSHAMTLMARIYVGSISQEIREDQIRNAFEVFGSLKALNMSYDSSTGDHKGYAFIDYEVPEGAELAIKSMDGQLLGGRNLKVVTVDHRQCLPQLLAIVEKMKKEAKKYFRVYISSVHLNISESSLTSVFEEFGKVIRCQLARNIASEGHKGFGYIEFDSQSAMQNAISGMNMFDLGGKFLRVGKCITPPEVLKYTHFNNITAASQTTSVLPVAAAEAVALVTAQLMGSKAPSGTEGSDSSSRRRDYVLEAKTRLKQAVDSAKTGKEENSPPQEAKDLPSIEDKQDPKSSDNPRPISSSSIEPIQPELIVPPDYPMEVASPGIFDPLIEKRKVNKKKKQKRAISLDQELNKLFQENKNLWEESLTREAVFGDSTNQQFETNDEEKIGRLAITGNAQSLALALINKEEKSLVAVGKPSIQTVTTEKDKKKKNTYRSNRVKEPKKIQPKLNTATKVAAAHAAGELSDAIREKNSSAEDVTLTDQESLQIIRGNDARHLLMAKLMRTNRSCILVLKEMIGPDDIDEFLEEEIREECSKSGEIDDIVIANFDNIVKIFVRFTKPEEVDEAIRKLNGRVFGGRIVKAESYDQIIFDHGDFTA